MKKTGFFFLMMVLMTSFKCEDIIKFNDNERLLFQGIIVDVAGEPLGNIPVEVRATRSYFNPYFPNYLDLPEGELSGEGVSDSDGNFNIISLASVNAEMYVVVNPSYSKDFQQNRTSFIVSGIDYRNDIENQGFRLTEEVVLDRKSNFRTRILRVTDNTDTLNYSIRFSPLVPIKNLQVKDTLAVEFDPNTIVGRMLPNELQTILDIVMRENDSILFSYSLSGEGIQRDSTIAINAQNRSFDFEF
ncbi:MAG: hypothetical protein AAGJ12_05370 [Bacteroidota bacterium]